MPIIVLIGGNGSNLQALIDNMPQGLFNIVGVISHRPNAYGLERARLAQIPTAIVDHQNYQNRQDFDNALIKQIQAFSPKLIVMAGFMRILSADFIGHFPGQILNIHPSLLPKYKGLNTHQRVLEAKELDHGVSVHFVTEELDGGPIVAQIKVPVLSTDNVESLTNKVHHAEHWLYPQVVGWYAENRLKFIKNIVTLDNERLDPQGKQLSLPTPTKGIVS